MSRLRLAVAAGCALALSACSLTTEVATQREYAAGDGIRVVVGDDVAIENLRAVSDGSEAYLLGLADNESDQPISITLTSTEHGVDESIDVDAKSAFNFGDSATIEDGSLIALGSLDQGTTVTLSVAAGGESTEANVPVISACQNGYEELFPNAECETEAPAEDDGH